MVQVLKSGKYEDHVGILRQRYAHKARLMLGAMREHFPDAVEVWEPKGGLYVWARLPAAVGTGTKSKLFQKALEHDVLYVPGGLCYAEDPSRPKPDHEMRICFGIASDKNILRGVARLGAVLRESMGGHGPHR